mgnify:CR=1 FL=1
MKLIISPAKKMNVDEPLKPQVSENEQILGSDPAALSLAANHVLRPAKGPVAL